MQKGYLKLAWSQTYPAPNDRDLQWNWQPSAHSDHSSKSSGRETWKSFYKSGRSEGWETCKSPQCPQLGASAEQYGIAKWDFQKIMPSMWKAWTERIFQSQQEAQTHLTIVAFQQPGSFQGARCVNCSGQILDCQPPSKWPQTAVPRGTMWTGNFRISLLSTWLSCCGTHRCDRSITKETRFSDYRQRKKPHFGTSSFSTYCFSKLQWRINSSSTSMVPPACHSSKNSSSHSYSFAYSTE